MPGWYDVICLAVYGRVGLVYGSMCLRLPPGPDNFRMGTFSNRANPNLSTPQPGSRLVVEVKVNWNVRKFRITRWGYLHCYTSAGGDRKDLVAFDPFMPSGYSYLRP